MKRTKVKAGTVILIPTDTNEYIPAKVLYVFQRYPNTLLLQLYSMIACNDKVPIPHELLSVDVAQLMITGTLYVNNGRWPSVGTAEVTIEEDHASLRVEGGQVIFKDEYLREASEADYSSLPRMAFTNISGAELYAQELAGKLRDG